MERAETEIDHPFPVTAAGTCRVGTPRTSRENHRSIPQSREAGESGRTGPARDGTRVRPLSGGFRGRTGPCAWINPGEV
ncbi:hypothetical protein GCM10010378_40550 [Streptomyces viridochromogenes]